MANGPIHLRLRILLCRVNLNSGISSADPAGTGISTPQPRIRIDKWLWEVRLYRTRSLAIAACRAGHVKVNGVSVKPAHDVRLQEIITAKTGIITHTVKVIGFPVNRVNAKLVPSFLEDLTPQSEYEKSREISLTPWYLRKKGLGRPTKKERRLLDQARADSL
jgi:ribosome-associated heat shock protein Hsp15